MPARKIIDYDEILGLLEKYKGDKKKVCKDLGITDPTLRNRMSAMKRRGYESKYFVIRDSDLSYKGMPTNEERIRYLDKRP